MGRNNRRMPIVRHIDVQQYMTCDDAKRVADRVVDVAGLNPNDVESVTVYGDHARAVVLRYRFRGRVVLPHRELRRAVVRVPGRFR